MPSSTLAFGLLGERFVHTLEGRKMVTIMVLLFVLIEAQVYKHT